MSKSKNLTAPKSTTPSEKIKQYFAKVAAAKAARLKKLRGAIVLMLYIRGDNGRMSGRASGNVYMRNGRIRQFVVPRLVQNTHTSTARSQFAGFSTAWAGLDDGQRASWNNVTNVFKPDRFGNDVLIRGKQLFIERNCNLLDTAQSLLTNYVDAVPIPGITILTPTTTTTVGVLTTVSLAFTPSPTESTVEHKLFATAPLPAGISRPKSSQFRFFDVIPNSTASPFVALAAYQARFGANAAIGQKIFFKVVPISNVTGQAGVPLIAEAIVT